MQKAGESGGLTLLMAAACGLLAANIYLSQTLVGPIGRQLGMAEQSTGLIVTLTQLGYCCGLVLLVPLADLVENRRLSVLLTLGGCVALTLQGFAPSANLFLSASFLVGLTSVVVQVLVPLAAHLASEERRGRVVGKVMGGLMAGIMLARPVASAVAQAGNWAVVFWLAAAMTFATAAILARFLPVRRPEGGLSYRGLLSSMAHLYKTTPILQQRGFYQAMMFGAFSVFWTAVPLYLAAPPAAWSQGKIALFSLAGAAGVIAAPLAGALADKGRLVLVTVGSMLLVAIAFLLSPLVPPSSSAGAALLVATAIGIDFGVTANLVVSQREIFSLAPEFRSRLNGLFISTFFLGGAAGSALGAWAFARGGWSFTAHLGAALPCVALLVFLALQARKSRKASLQ